MAIEPDTKDWTWVLGERCGECGFDAGAYPAAQVSGRIRSDLPRWEALLRRDTVRDRPVPSVWSPLEYAAHVRDVFRLFQVRTELMLREDNPFFANWDQDQTAEADNYAGQQPLEVSDGLWAAGLEYAALLDSVSQWERTGRRSNGSVFTIATLTQYGLHDVVHHLHDVAG